MEVISLLENNVSKLLSYNKSTIISEFLLQIQGIIPRAVNDRVSELMVPESKKEEFIKEAETLPSVEINQIDLQWVQVLGEGWASPLKGKF